MATILPYPDPSDCELTVPVTTIPNLSAGEFVGMVTENPYEIITLKTFHAMIVNDQETLKPIPVPVTN